MVEHTLLEESKRGYKEMLHLTIFFITDPTPLLLTMINEQEPTQSAESVHEAGKKIDIDHLLHHLVTDGSNPSRPSKKNKKRVS